MYMFNAATSHPIAVADEILAASDRSIGLGGPYHLLTRNVVKYHNVDGQTLDGE